jgi:phosphoglycolate phosphatase
MKRLFLDLDGPLLDGKDRHYHCYRSILERHGFTAVSIDEYWEKKRSLLSRMDLLDLSCATRIYDDFLVEWLATIESPSMLALDKVQEGAIECLRGWKEQGIALTLVTMRRDRNALEKQLNSTGLRQFLDTVLVCDHARGGLGKADAVRNVIEGKLNPVDALWIGDTEADWEAGNSLGCGVVLVSNGLRNESCLRLLRGAKVRSSILSLKDDLFEGFDVG